MYVLIYIHLLKKKIKEKFGNKKINLKTKKNSFADLQMYLYVLLNL